MITAFPADIGLMQTVALGETAEAIHTNAVEILKNRGVTTVELMYILIAHELTRPRVVVRTMSESVAVKEALN